MQLVYTISGVWRLLIILKPILTLEENSLVIYIIEQWSNLLRQVVTTTTFLSTGRRGEYVYEK